MTTVFIADDHPVVLSGLKSFVDGDKAFTVIGTAQDGRATIEAIASLKPDIAIVDLNMPLANGLEVLASTKGYPSSTAIVVMAASASDAEVHALLENGALGLLFKESAAQDLLDCLRAVAGGQHWFSASMVASLGRYEQHAIAWRESLQALTPQERKVASLAGTGSSNKQIAYLLDVSEGTVKVHLNSIFRKLGLSHRSDLMGIASGLGPTSGQATER